MHNIKDLWIRASTEAQRWYSESVRMPGVRMSLYFEAANGDHGGDIIVSAHDPGTRWEQVMEIPVNLTKDQVYKKICEAVGKLPILN